MELVVSGLRSEPGFKHLWGRYVLGFKPSEHCIACFRGKSAVEINPGMKDGTYLLNDEHPFFYLCGVGQPDRKTDPEYLHRRFTNVHLAVRPLKGSVASVGSTYGAVFTIFDAQQIPITPVEEPLPDLPEAHTRCKNFQFGFQVFEAGQEDFRNPDRIVTQVRPKYRANDMLTA